MRIAPGDAGRRSILPTGGVRTVNEASGHGHVMGFCLGACHAREAGRAGASCKARTRSRSLDGGLRRSHICASSRGDGRVALPSLFSSPNNYMIKKDKASVLFVCLGNICRSPLVEAVARLRCAQAGLPVTLASCGTSNWHVRKGADPRMLRAAAAAGYDLTPHRARQVQSDDFARYDWVLAMDSDNLQTLRSLRDQQGSEPELFLPWAGVASPMEFPDPYFGDEGGFRRSIALAERAVDGLITRLLTGWTS